MQLPKEQQGCRADDASPDIPLYAKAERRPVKGSECKVSKRDGSI